LLLTLLATAIADAGYGGRHFWSPREMGLAVGNLAETPVGIMGDGTETHAIMSTEVPQDYEGGINTCQIWVTGTTGTNTNVYLSQLRASYSSAAPDNRNQVTASVAAGVHGVNYDGVDRSYIDCVDAFAGLSLQPQGLLSFWFARDGSQGADTYNADLWVTGVSITYTATVASGGDADVVMGLAQLSDQMHNDAAFGMVSTTLGMFFLILLVVMTFAQGRK
jgi:hypothetical protein